MIGILYGFAAESFFKFLITFKIIRILNLISDIMLVLGVYDGGVKPVWSLLELDAKNKA